jgi:hypothetical protein
VQPHAIPHGDHRFAPLVIETGRPGLKVGRSLTWELRILGLVLGGGTKYRRECEGGKQNCD